MNDEGSGWFVIIIALAMCAWAFDWDPFSDEIMEYPRACIPSFDSDGNCYGEQGVAERTAYKVFQDRQEVLFWSPSTNYLQKLDSCVVRNRKHWQCYASFPTQEIVFIDGVRQGFSTIGNPDKHPVRLKYISKIRWWLEWAWSLGEWSTRDLAHIEGLLHGASLEADAYWLGGRDGKILDKDEYMDYLNDRYRMDFPVLGNPPQKK